MTPDEVWLRLEGGGWLRLSEVAHAEVAGPFHWSDRAAPFRVLFTSKFGKSYTSVEGFASAGEAAAWWELKSA